jgi:drug/metabolite transporter (DMT)-like permease
MLAGAVILAPAAGLEAVLGGPPSFGLRSAAIVGYLGLVCSGAGYLMWNTGLARLGAVRSSVYLYLQPVAAIAIALPVLGERPGLAAALGGLVVVAGTVLAAGR